MNAAWLTLLPELREIDESRRDAALRAARDEPLSVAELLGVAAALVVVTATTRYAVPGAEAVSSRYALALLNFAVALPMLALLLGPLHWRRLRRGLRGQLRRPRG